ncbi:MAG: molybdopterin cofactor-binding domain-containing protein, partial [Chloroflexota bacterium]|nr:molybdopterin cofactor-binding domain-containing protein [Chloroflexota bacterium]
MKKETITLTVNNQPYTLPIIPGETLASLLRERLNLTGTKIGCEEAECGACTVLVNDEPVLSCVYPAARADGKTVVTVEGLAKYVHQVMKLHPIQEAFVEHGAVQCGFCIPGQIMTAFALLKRNPNPTQEEIRYALKDNLCRCGGYPMIEKAILAAAHTLQTGDPLPLPKIYESIHKKEFVGRKHLRPDAVEKVTGKAIFTDDLHFDNMLYAKVRRAMVPHAILKTLDISEAKALEGVKAVLTAEDIPGEQNHGLIIYDWPAIIGVGQRVRYVGDAIAIVAAETREIAAQAAMLIKADFELLPVISNPIQALEESQPKLHEKGNLLKHIKVRKGDVSKGFKEAELILEHTFHTQTTDHAFMEPECSIAVPIADGRMEVYVGSQIPYEDRSQVARAMGWEDSRVRIVGQKMGGGFGGKEDIAGQIHATLLADATQHPVKLLYDRHESLLAHPKRHATQIRVKLGAKEDGRITAVETELYGDTGAYASLGEKVMERATTHSAGPYDVPHVRNDCYAMYTNNPPSGAYRGFGVTQSAFAIESMMDMLAEKLDMDPVKLRKINVLHVGSITSTGQVLNESVGLTKCLERVNSEMRKSNPEPFKPVADPGNPNLVRAWGIGAAYKNTGLGGGAPDFSNAEIELYDDGTFEIRSAAAELGQGLVAVMQLIVSEEMSISPDNVRVLVMDTDLTPDGGPTTASRQTYMTGNASRLAAQTLRNAIITFLSEKFEVEPENVVFKDGFAHVKDQRLSFAEIAKQMKRSGQKPRAHYKYDAPKTQPLGTGGDMHFAYSYSVQAAEVEVNKFTGEVTVLKVISANDLGMAINPLGLQGQIEGGVMMGLGHCLTEEFVVEEGHIITDQLARYRIPGIMLTPEITSIVIEEPTADGPYGAKGVGEISSIPTTPAITNAIYHAVGVRIDKTPVDQEVIAKALCTKN